MEIQHFSHQHPLTLVLNDVDRDDHRCKICFEKLERGSDHYGCKECGLYKYNIHKPCADFPRELQHPSHPKHRLLFDLHHEEECSNCSSHRFMFKYKCSDHCEFYLCPECAFLPLSKTVDIHDHPLTLMRKPLPFMCDGCRKEDIGMFYFCSTCLFAVHSNSKCTSLPLIVRPTSTIQAAIHSHPLTLERKLLSFTCDACGNDGNGTFYFCATCSFVAHLDCAFLPSVVQVIRHKHPLNLIYSLPANHFKRRVPCQLCSKTVDTNYWLYYCCSSHDFVAHLHCATSKEDRDETFVPNSKDEEDRPNKDIDLLPYIVKKTKPGGDGTEIQTEIKHFSHQHDLKLINKPRIKYTMCNGCIRPIFPPYYACAQCRFFLHKSCAELPKRLRLSVHQHSLKLELGEPRVPFVCDTCLRLCNGFNYRCAECKFDLDVHCSLIPDIFTHPSHEHALILARSSEVKNCSVCGSRTKYKFSCVDCEFTLDFECLTLPHMVSYKKHDHPFTLCYISEDDSGEYYCDICEKIRDSKCWFYYCADCSYPAHPKCILEKYLNLKENSSTPGYIFLAKIRRRRKALRARLEAY